MSISTICARTERHPIVKMKPPIYARPELDRYLQLLMEFEIVWNAPAEIHAEWRWPFNRFIRILYRRILSFRGKYVEG